MNDTDDPFKDWDAAYVLGALSADERKEYEVHLARCDNCSHAVAIFAGIPGILSKVDSQTAITLIDGLPTDSDLGSLNESTFIQKLAKRAEEERRKTRIRQTTGLVAAAVISITIGVSAGGAFHSPSKGIQPISNEISGKAIRVTNIKPEIMTATFRVTSRPWGTRFDWNCLYATQSSPRYSSSNYNLIVVDTSGRQTIIATWNANGATATGLAATSALPVSQIKTIEITPVGSSNVLVRGEI